MILHYFYDPLCGWCYGAAPLVQAARDLVDIVAHGGGLMAGPQRQPVTAQLRAYVVPHDQKIAQMTGQTFGTAYVDGLLRDPTAVFDSAPPITAILAAEQLARRGLDLLRRLQIAHYVEGRRIADASTLNELALDLGLDAPQFKAAMAALTGAATTQHISDSRALLRQAGGAGFPTFVAETNGRLDIVPVAPYLGKPAAWVEHLKRYV